MCLAVPGRVIAIEGEGEFSTARVDFGGVTREASLVFVPDTKIGDYVLVHVGFALNRIDEAAAQDALDALRAIGELDVPPAGDGNAIR
ncbi:MAG: HypC/HybG/HupF family hydrogenase formation chaperone [Deltaproteobacteria bacterium]|nr:HypC/HybG/HupF family hydrogenase formation chaperone [Deltaproteobacteria bacterium]